MKDATILYYSSNKENSDFENKVIENIKKNCGDLPIISVTFKPMDFGKNICVGEHVPTGFNMFRQVLLGCKEVQTEFIISAESDCLYPPDYFTFRPERNDAVYRDANLYVMGDHRNYYWAKPEGATHAQIVGRLYYIEMLEKLFKDAPEWSDTEKNFPKERWGKEDIFDTINYYKTENPVIQIKTHQGMRYYTHSDRTPIYSLPYWGEGKILRKKYL